MIKGLRWYHPNLKDKIFLSLVGCCLLCLMIFGLGSYFRSSAHLNLLIEYHLKTVAENVYVHVQSYLKNKSDTVSMISSRTQLRTLIAAMEDNVHAPDASQKIQTILADAESVNDEIIRVSAFNLEGKFISSSDEKSNSSHLSKEQLSFISSQPLPAFSVRNESSSLNHLLVYDVMEQQGTPIGIIETVFSLDSFKEIIIQPPGLSVNLDLIIFYNDGEQSKLVIPIEYQANLTEEAILKLPFTQRKPGETSSPIFEFIDEDATPYLGLTRYLRSVNWGVVVKLKKDDIYAILYEQEQILIYTVLVILFVTYITAKLLAYRINQPIAQLNKTLKAVAQGNYDSLPEVKRKDELGSLAQSVVQMVLKIRTLVHSLTQTQEAVAQSIVEAVITIDNHCIIQACNEATSHLFGYQPNELIGRNVKLLMPDDIAHHHDNYVNNYITTRDAKVIGTGREVVAKRKDGTTFHAHLSISEIPSDDKTLFVGVITDITDRTEFQKQLMSAAFYNSLTGLPNRRLFDDRLNCAITMSKRRKEKFAIVIFDFNDYRPANEHYGFVVNDYMISELADRLRSSVRESDTCSHYESDEFIFLANNVKDREAVNALTRKLYVELAKPIMMPNRYVEFHPKVGVAIYPDDGDDALSLLAHATQQTHEKFPF